MSAGIILMIWLLGIGLLAVELFIPGLVVGAIGTVCVLGSIGLMFHEQGAAPGLALSAASLLLGGGIIYLAAKRFALKVELKTEDGFVGTDDHSSLVGMTGTTLTPLRPGGFASIGGKRVDVVTNGEMVAKDVPVEVVRVEGNRIEVRPVEPSA